MGTLIEDMLDALEELEIDELKKFKRCLQQPENVEGLKPLPRCLLENAERTGIIDLLLQSYPSKAGQILVNVLQKIKRNDLAKKFTNTANGSETVGGEDEEDEEKSNHEFAGPHPPGPPPSAQCLFPEPSGPGDIPGPGNGTILNLTTASQVDVSSTPVDVSPTPEPPVIRNRMDFLKDSCQLSLDINTVYKTLSLSEENRKVTHTYDNQRYPYHADRFTYHEQVLSRERLSERCYFEVEWSGDYVDIAVSYKDINRRDGLFGSNDKSWMLGVFSSEYRFNHNNIETKLSGPDPFPEGAVRVVDGEVVHGGVYGVHVDHSAGTMSFYSVSKSNDKMTLLKTVQTTITQPLYAGLYVRYDSTAEVCKIW